VLAYGGPGHVETAGDLAGGQFGAGHEPQDGAAARLGEGAEGLVHLLVPLVLPRAGREPVTGHGPPPSR